MIDIQGKFTVETWGRVYRSNGPTFGKKGVIEGLTYDDVCEQVIAHSRRDDCIFILQDGVRVSIGRFIMS